VISAVGILQVHQELTVDPAHLPRVLRSLRRVCSHVVAYDDGSADGSAEWLAAEADVLIRGARNDWKAELAHKEAMLRAADQFEPDWIVWLDADEELSPGAVKEFHQRDKGWRRDGVTGVRILECNLWRDRLHRRLDTKFEDGWFMRFWRWRPGLSYGRVADGLHQTQFPPGISTREIRLDPETCRVIHYSWDSPRKIEGKLERYRRAGDLANLPRMTDHGGVQLGPVPDEWRWTSGEEEGMPRPWSRPFMGPAHEHALKILAHRATRVLELGGGESTVEWARRLCCGGTLATWEPAGSPWEVRALEAREICSGRGSTFSLSTTMGGLEQLISGDHGPFDLVLVDHEIPGVPAMVVRGSAVRSLWTNRARVLAPGAVVALHDAQDYGERAGFETVSEDTDPNWIANPDAKLWIGRVPT
jgi:hypothetical protein